MTPGAVDDRAVWPLGFPGPRKAAGRGESESGHASIRTLRERPRSGARCMLGSVGAGCCHLDDRLGRLPKKPVAQRFPAQSVPDRTTDSSLRINGHAFTRASGSARLVHHLPSQPVDLPLVLWTGAGSPHGGASTELSGRMARPEVSFINPSKKTTRQEALQATISPGPLPAAPPISGFISLVMGSLAPRNRAAGTPPRVARVGGEAR
jgi:hypothetical protein